MAPPDRPVTAAAPPPRLPAPAPTPATSPGTLTVAQGAALSVGAVLGTGVITLPALAANVAGPASLVAWAIAPLSGEYRNPRRDIPRAAAIAVTVVGVLYLGLAATSVLVLGPAAGESQAPLSPAPPASGPPWPATARCPGPAALSLVVTAVLELGLTSLMLLATGCFTLVYVLGTGAALRLLPRRSLAWWTAVVAFVATLGLLVVNGVNTLWALGIVAASLGYQAWARAGRTA